MKRPATVNTSVTTASTRSSLPAKWYEINRVLDRPARRAICANDAFAKPSSAIVAIAADTICARRATVVTDRSGSTLTDTSKSYYGQVKELKIGVQYWGRNASRSAARELIPSLGKARYRCAPTVRCDR